MNNYSGILLVTNSNSLLLQQRDINPNIVNPGLVTTFGGKVEGNETPLEGALREIREESNLNPKEKDLLFFKNFTKIEKDGTQTLLHIYILRNVSTKDLEIYEGEGYFEIQREDNLSKIKLSPTAKEIITEYFNTY